MVAGKSKTQQITKIGLAIRVQHVAAGGEDKKQPAAPGFLT